MEAETKDGGCKLHNLELSDCSLKIGWLKRIIKTNTKWEVLPTMFQFSDISKFGTDYTDRICEITFRHQKRFCLC